MSVRDRACREGRLVSPGNLAFRVFISSTFTDMVVERNALHETVFPALRKYCQRRGAEFQAVDLRWGVSTEAQLGQKTLSICLQEVLRCQELSPRPSFIALLGDRYGWRPLPSEIDADEFRVILQQLGRNGRSQLLRWYRCDANAVPPEFCLLPRTGRFMDDEVWADEEARVRGILLHAVDRAFPAASPEQSKYADSGYS